MTVTTKRTPSSYCRRGDHVSCTTAHAVCECACHVVPVRPVPDPEMPKARARRAWVTKRAKQATVIRPRVRKEDAPCCQARALPDGRPCIGYCGPECIRRPSKPASGSE